MRKITFKKIIGITLAFALSVASAGCGNSADNSNDSTSTDSGNGTVSESSYEGLTIRVADQPSSFRLEVADALGYFEEEFGKDGITVERPFFNDGPSFVDAVATDQVDLGIYGDQPLIAGYASGKAVEIIGRFSHDSQNFNIVASPQSGITKVEDFKGKRIACVAGGTTQKMLLKVLEKEGLSENDIELTYLSGSDTVTALAQGNIDASILFGENAVAALTNGGIFISDLTSYAEDVQIIAASTNFVEKYPELAARFLKVVEKTNQYINENKEDTIKIVMEARQLTEEQAEALYDSEEREVGYSAKDAQALNETAQFLYDQGVISKLVTADEFVDTQYLELAGFTVEK